MKHYLHVTCRCALNYFILPIYCARYSRRLATSSQVVHQALAVRNKSNYDAWYQLRQLHLQFIFLNVGDPFICSIQPIFAIVRVTFSLNAYYSKSRNDNCYKNCWIGLALALKRDVYLGLVCLLTLLKWNLNAVVNLGKRQQRQRRFVDSWTPHQAWFSSVTDGNWGQADVVAASWRQVF